MENLEKWPLSRRSLLKTGIASAAGAAATLWLNPLSTLPVQAASIAAWKDERHVRDNRALYQAKFSAVLAILQPVMEVAAPAAGFYLWPYVHFDDQQFARRLYAEQNVTVLPGSYLSRSDHTGVNPGQNRVRLALVPSLEECVDAAQRLREFVRGL